MQESWLHGRPTAEGQKAVKKKSQGVEQERWLRAPTSTRSTLTREGERERIRNTELKRSYSISEVSSRVSYASRGTPTGIGATYSTSAE